MSEERIPKRDALMILAGALILGGGILAAGLWFFWPLLARAWDPR